MTRRADDEASRPSDPAGDSTLPVYVVFNPMSGKGRGAQFVTPLLQALAEAPGLEDGLTREPGGEARPTAEALARGVRRSVAGGGGGPLIEVGSRVPRPGVPARRGPVP